MSCTVNKFNASQFFVVEQHYLYLRFHSTEGRISMDNEMESVWKKINIFYVLELTSFTVALSPS